LGGFPSVSRVPRRQRGPNAARSTGVSRCHLHHQSSMFGTVAELEGLKPRVTRMANARRWEGRMQPQVCKATTVHREKQGAGDQPDTAGVAVSPNLAEEKRSQQFLTRPTAPSSWDGDVEPPRDTTLKQGASYYGPPSLRFLQLIPWIPSLSDFFAKPLTSRTLSEKKVLALNTNGLVLVRRRTERARGTGTCFGRYRFVPAATGSLASL